MLDLADIEPYLRERGLISARAVVEGGLRITDVSRLNRVFLVTAEDASYVVKIGKEPGGQTVAREAAVLDRLWDAGAGRRLTRFLPAIVAYDRPAGALILKATRGSRDLNRHHAHGRFSRALARQAGRALAALHDLAPGVVGDLAGEVEPTWSLRLHRPDLDSLHCMSAAAIDLTRIIQGSERLCSALDELLESWSPTSAIHGDVRWDNCLVLRGSGSDHWTRIQVIDWELAGAGDPARDIGAFFGEYLRVWIQSIPIARIDEPGRLLAHAGVPLRRMRPALGAFWDGYADERRCSAAELSSTLRRATRFAGAAMLLAACEEAQMLDGLPARVLLLMPVSQSLLERPEEATAHLLGLPRIRAAA